MNHVTNKKLNNKGFSLVELIIVVAIMAVLVGVLAPQYLKYVERSRVSTDRDNVEAIVSALQVYAVDPDATSVFDGSESIVLSRNAVPNITDSTDTPVADALANAGIQITDIRVENRQEFAIVTIDIDVTGDVVTVTPVESTP